MTLNNYKKIWRDAAPKLAFNAHGFEAEIILDEKSDPIKMTAPVLIEAMIDHKNFSVYIEQNLVENIFANSQANISFGEMSRLECGVVFEHLFTEPLQNLEKKLGADITIIGVSLVKELPEENRFDFFVNSFGNVFSGVFVSDDNDILERISKALLPFQVPGEKNCSDICDVVIGPIDIIEEDLAEIQVGDLVSLGQKVDKEMQGYIYRQSGTIWKAMLEPSVSVITSGPQKISSLLPKNSHTKSVGIKIGTLNIPASNILGMKIKDSFKIERLANNEALLILDKNIIASGNLQHVNNVICLAVNNIGEANANR